MRSMSAPHLGQSLRHSGIRPLTLLNANSGAPSNSHPTRDRRLERRKRDRIPELDAWTGSRRVMAGRRISAKTTAPRILIVALNQRIASLSKPLPVALAPETSLNLVALK